MDKRLFLSAALAALLCLAQLTPRVAAAPPPTKAQLKAELVKMADYVAAKFPGYSNYTNSMKKYIGIALNTKLDLSFLPNCTMLIPNNKESQAFFTKVPFSAANMMKIYNVTAYHIIRIKRLLPPLKALKPGTALLTQVKQPLFKMNAVNYQTVSFGKGPRLPAATWSTIQMPRMYVGPYFIAHGVNKILIPAGTKVP